MARVVFVTLCVAATMVAAEGGPQQPTFYADSITVPIYTTVVDADGRLVPDLGREDFAVFDDGEPQPLTVFANSIQPITIVIMLDRSGSMERNFGLVRSAAERFLDHLRPDDRVRLGSFSNHVRIDPADFTDDRDELRRILREDLQGPGTTPLWNATGAAMTALRGREGRRVVLVFTDGFDTPDAGLGNVRFADVRDRAIAEDVMVYAIGLSDPCTQAGGGGFRPGRPRYQRRGPGRGFPPIGRGPIGGPIGGPRGPGPTDGDGPPVGRPGGIFGRPPVMRNAGPRCVESQPDPSLRELAGVSGGGYFELGRDDDLGSTFARIAEELHQQYMLGFTPQVLDGRTHALDVRLRDPDLAARARQHYVATVRRDPR